ncbi:hypothetical protein [Buttiauxella sp. S19-1]|uniref:hypothetical protein n=1 Tax=Buttiauxella sp. S19-1 TaxID=941430 RepID=UPI001EDA838A|nr:hypothetical protein [Buttiauxella sp. S19-1]
MKKSFFFAISLFLASTANAANLENRASDVLKYKKWFVVEFTMPTTIAYKVGTESNLPSEQQTFFIDMSPLSHCQADKITVNQFIGYKQMDFSSVPFIPIKYKISGQEVKDSVAKPEVSEGFLFTSIESIQVSELLKAKDKGNFSFWIQPPAESKEPINKMFFPLNGFSEAYNKAVQLCKDNM